MYSRKCKGKGVLLHAMQAHRKETYVCTPFIFDPGTSSGRVVSATARPLYPREE